MSTALQPSPEGQARLDAFLVALSALSEQHGITIGGCGCCDSPSLDLLPDPEKGGRYQVDGPAKVNHDGTSFYLPGNLKWVK